MNKPYLLFFKCGSAEEGNAIYKMLWKKFYNLIESEKLYKTTEGGFILQITTKKISESTFKPILAEIKLRSENVTILGDKEFSKSRLRKTLRPLFS